MPAVTTVVGRLAAAVEAMAVAQERVLVGIDGPDTASKSTLADALATALPRAGRASVDDLPRSPAERYQWGELSPEGYYRDSFDVDRLVQVCLRPFRDGPDSGVLVVDGVFLLRPELRSWWDLAVYLTVPEEEVLRRARERDASRFGSVDEVERRYRARYLPAQALYRAEADPGAVADVLVDNEDPAAPQVLRWGAQGPQ
jgi:uridine kinase